MTYKELLNLVTFKEYAAFINGGVSRMAPKLGTAVCKTACTVA